MDQPLILLVDDQEEFLEIFGTKLSSLGYRIAKARSGAEALAQAKTFHPSLILLDVDMPGMNGAETLAALKDDALSRDAKIVFLTNLGGPEDIQKSFNERISKEIGAAGYIKKTTDLEIIAEEIKKYIPA